MEDELVPNQEFLYNWTQAWVTMREYPVKTEHGHLAILRTSTDRWEYLSHNPSLEYVETKCKIVLQSPGSRIAIVTEDDKVEEYKAAIAKSGLTLAAQEAMMVVDLQADDDSSKLKKSGFDVEVKFANGFTVVKVMSAGELAASGQVCVRNGVAVYDRIVTEEQWRRRGLGSLVMTNLTADSISRGSKQGLLIASADGEFLYGRLGWTKEHHVLVAQVSSTT